MSAIERTPDATCAAPASTMEPQGDRMAFTARSHHGPSTLCPRDYLHKKVG